MSISSCMQIRVATNFGTWSLIKSGMGFHDQLIWFIIRLSYFDNAQKIYQFLFQLVWATSTGFIIFVYKKAHWHVKRYRLVVWM